jgi:rhodanese-related sulfurtransferase
MEFIEQLWHFLLNHWMLSSALLMVLILLFLEDARTRAGGGRLSPQDLTNLVNREQATVIDLRDTDSFAKGHIAGAVNVPQPAVANSIEKLKKYQEKAVILVDNAGNQALLIAAKLRKQGFKRVHCLQGGIMAWKDAGLPLTK